MGALKNLRCYTEPETTLFQQEIDVINEVVSAILMMYSGNPSKGTFILGGHKHDEAYQDFIFYNLSDGPASLRRGRVMVSSDEVARATISTVMDLPDHDTADRPPTGIHHTKSGYPCLALPTTAGRFLCGFTTFNRRLADYNYEEVFLTVSESIAQMCKEDPVLQESNEAVWQEVASQADTNGQRFLLGMRKMIEWNFKECRLSSIKAWKDWHDDADSSGKLSLFFE